MQGWISLHRKMLQSDIFQNEKMFKIFMYCLMKATHKERKQRVGMQVIDLEKGQFIFGRNVAASELNMNESTVYQYVKILEEDGAITIDSNNKFSVVSVVNWEFYQDNNNNVTTKEQQNNNKITTKEQQNNTNNNVNNVDNVNKEQDPFSEEQKIFDYYISKNLIKHKTFTPKMKQEVRKALSNVDYKYTVDEIKRVIDNYATVYESDNHWFRSKYDLIDLMRLKDLRQFSDDKDPLNNFLINKNINSKDETQKVARF